MFLAHDNDTTLRADSLSKHAASQWLCFLLKAYKRRQRIAEKVKDVKAERCKGFYEGKRS
jgi:hypothetical protein